MTDRIKLAEELEYLSPLERAKAQYRPMRSIDEILGLEREIRKERP